MGALRSLNGHLATCKFALLLCPNECQKAGKVVELLRKDIETHTKEECPRRQYECPHCKEFGEHHERTTEHLSVCPMKEVPCPKLGCRMNIARRNLSEHRKECKFEMVPCKYEIIGCKTEVLRKDMAKHEEDTQQHLQLAVDTVRQQQITIREQDSTIRDMQAQSRKMPMTFKLTNFNQHKTADNTFYSPAFYTSPGGYKMCIDVEANGYGEGKGTYVSVYAHLMKGENDDYLSWPFTGTLTIELLNQLEDNNHQSEIIIFPADDDKYGQRVLTEEIASSAWGCPLYISHSNLAHNAAKNCQYLKDDRLHFRISANAKESSTPWLI